MKALRSLMTVSSLFVAGTICTTEASEFRTLGPRALSMGGASVACPAPAYAAYYNPAALGLKNRGAFDMALGLGIRDTGISEHLDTLMAYDWESATANPEGPEATAIIRELRKIKSTDAIMITPAVAIGLRIGSAAAGIYPSAQIALYAHLDTTHLNQTSPFADPNSFAFNSSTLYAQGLGLVEVPVACGHAFKVGKDGKLCIGGALKFIEAATYDIRQDILITSDADEIQDKLEDGSKMSVGFGIDLGVLYSTFNDRLSIGLLARNLNSPDFATVTGASFSEDAQLRAGAAFKITREIIVAVDIDLTVNETLVPGYNSRQLSAGIGYEGGHFSLRGGLMKNLEADGSPTAWSLGISVGGETLHLDVTGSVSGSWQTYDQYSFPDDGSFMIALGGGW